MGDFLEQFREPPRAAFAQALARRLASADRRRRQRHAMAQAGSALGAAALALALYAAPLAHQGDHAHAAGPVAPLLQPVRYQQQAAFASIGSWHSAQGQLAVPHTPISHHH